jgi:hypothetical protein
MTLVATAGANRYVHINIRCWMSPRKRLAFLAHELQHALEIAESPGVVDADTMEAFYETVGFQTYTDGTHREFETKAALAVQRLVEEEVYDARVAAPGEDGKQR